MLVYGECECFVMQMFVSCVHPVAVLNAAFCMTHFLPYYHPIYRKYQTNP